MTSRLEQLERENRSLRAELDTLRRGEPARGDSRVEHRPGFAVELLGVPAISRLAVDGERQPVAVRLRRAWRGVALLALAPGQRVGREELVRTLWPEADAARVRRNLPPTIYAMRRSLGEALPGTTAIETAANTYALSPALVWWIDALEFESAIDAGRDAERRGDDPAAESRWTEALALYRGPFLTGDDDPWVEEQRERFRRRRLELLRLLGDLRLRRGDLERALDAYRLGLAEEPLQEDLHLALLRIYAMQGRRDLVRRHFDRFSRLLADELGVEPGLDTTLEYHRLMAAAERQSDG